MKRSILVIGVLASLVFSGCNALKNMAKLAKDQQLTVNPSPLEVHADTVNFEMSALLPVKMLKKDLEYVLETSYQYGSQSVKLDDLTFKGNDFPNSGEQQPRLSNEYSFAYDDTYESGNVVIQGVARNPANGKEIRTETLSVAPGIITTSKLVKDVLFCCLRRSWL